MPFTFSKTTIEGIKLIQCTEISDRRGSFWECFKQSDFTGAGINATFIQSNCSISQKKVLRGLHFQAAPYQQGKLVKTLTGAIFDVAVDIRQNSATYGQWFGTEISAQNKKMLWIPPGFAHGFLTLEDNTLVHYNITGAEYTPSHERSLRWNDSDIGITWPYQDINLSDKDQQGLSLKEYDSIISQQGIHEDV